MKGLDIFGWKSILTLHLLIIGLRIGYILIGGYDLDAEEAQYWLWSKFPDWSYYSKPPLIAYINRFTTTLAGSYEWSVRLNAVLLGSLVGLGVYYISREIYQNKKLAYSIAAGLLILPAYHYISLFFTTDVLAVLGWLFTTYFFWVAVTRNHFKKWFLAGLVMGLGLLGKYTLLYFIPFSFLYLFFAHRSLLHQKGYYLFLLTGSLLFLPVVIWNFNNGFIGVFHVAHLAGAGRDFPGWTNSLTYISEFIGGQLLLNLPLLSLFFFWRTKNVFQFFKGDFERYILSAAGFVFCSFLVLSIFERIRINWLIFCYFPLYIVVWRAILSSGTIRKAKVYLALTVLLLLGLLAQPVFAVHGYAYSSYLPPRIDPFAKLIGWQQLGQYLDQEIRGRSDGKRLIILSDQYQIAAQMSFYVPGQAKTYCLPYATRRMNQFDLWGIPEHLSGKENQIVFIKTSKVEESPLEYNLIPSEIILEKTEFHVVYKQKQIKTFYLYLLSEMPPISFKKEAFLQY